MKNIFFEYNIFFCSKIRDVYLGNFTRLLFFFFSIFNNTSHDTGFFFIVKNERCCALLQNENNDEYSLCIYFFCDKNLCK